MRNKSARVKKLTVKAAASVELPNSSASKRATSSKTSSSTTSKASAKAAVKGARTLKERKTKIATSTAKRKASASMRVSRAAASATSSPSSSTSRGRSTATLIEAEEYPPSSSRSSSASTSRAGPSRGKAAPAKSPRAPKRKRAPSVDKDEELRALAQRLKDLEKGVREREREVKKREAAITKKSNAMQRTEEGFSREREAIQKRVQSLVVKRREVDAESKELASLRKRLTAEEKVLHKRTQRTFTAVGVVTEPLWALTQLEENFTCSLCYEIMACPYTLAAGRCGHSFCSICILQWCFAAVHRGCGYWHDSLECPLCRAELPYTSDHVPRSLFSFPFTPNRLADSTIKALVELIRSADPQPGSSGAGSGSGVCTLVGRTDTTTASCEDEKLLLWRGTGAAYVDWEERDNKGRTEMTLLANQWTTLQADDFVAFKDRLGV